MDEERFMAKFSFGRQYLREKIKNDAKKFRDYILKQRVALGLGVSCA